MIRAALRPMLPPLLLLLLAPLAGCQALGYYGQAIGGHLSIITAGQPVDQLIADPATDGQLRRRLEVAREARDFASAELGLPDNDSYRSYVDLGRPFATWNVIAAGEFSVDAETWCFPIAGCVAYRGYYAEDAAEGYAAGLRTRGLDVAVNGAVAYSTLGWFDDPLLSSMLRGDQLRTVGLIFHELAHQRLYVADDSDFNEAFATFVEHEGVRRWLAARRQEGDGEARYAAGLARREDFAALLGEARAELAAIYASDADAAAKRRAKAAGFDRLRTAYATLRDGRWEGYSGYDRWFDRELNNAHLVAVATYFRWVPAFAALYRQSGGELAAFYSAAAALGELPMAPRRARLRELLAASRAGAD